MIVIVNCANVPSAAAFQCVLETLSSSPFADLINSQETYSPSKSEI